jgi:hypothetical protein
MSRSSVNFPSRVCQESVRLGRYGLGSTPDSAAVGSKVVISELPQAGAFQLYIDDPSPFELAQLCHYSTAVSL